MAYKFTFAIIIVNSLDYCELIQSLYLLVILKSLYNVNNKTSK